MRSVSKHMKTLEMFDPCVQIENFLKWYISTRNTLPKYLRSLVHVHEDIFQTNLQGEKKP